ncbi:MAG: RDD family protein [Bacilli bacterium]
METSFKRLIAYIIDIAIVTIFVTILSNITFINPKMDDYNKNYTEYQNVISDKKDSKINDEDYEKKIVDINYELGRSNIINGTITVLSLVLYFGVFQFFFKGQTIGKKILKLKIVNNKEKKELNIFNYLIRTVVLNNIVFRLLILVSVYFLNKNIYYTFSTIIGMVESVIESIIFVMVVLTINNRGLHDILAHTKVIVVDDKPNIVTTKKVINCK